MIRNVAMLAVVVSVAASGAERSKKYCEEFEVAFSACGEGCMAQIKRLPEYRRMTMADLKQTLMGCTAICIEVKGYQSSDSVACDRYRPPGR